jgi:hypothetical protein
MQEARKVLDQAGRKPRGAKRAERGVGVQQQAGKPDQATRLT